MNRDEIVAELFRMQDKDYALLQEILDEKGAQTTLDDRRRLAARAFGVSSRYDTAIKTWFETKL